jgi:hypothetical protein
MGKGGKSTDFSAASEGEIVSMNSGENVAIHDPAGPWRRDGRANGRRRIRTTGASPGVWPGREVFLKTVERNMQ